MATEIVKALILAWIYWVTRSVLKNTRDTNAFFKALRKQTGENHETVDDCIKQLKKGEKNDRNKE